MSVYKSKKKKGSQLAASCTPADSQWNLLATCPKGVEFALASELKELGASEVQESIAAVYFAADEKTAYRICLWTRIASRIVVVLARTHANDVDDFNKIVQALPWSAWIDSREKTIAVDFNGSNQSIRDSRFGAQISKDGICDHFTGLHLPRPNVDPESPDVLIYARLYKNKLSIGIDLIGERLHKRGYRQQTGAAPLRENLAAALLRIAGWPAMARQAQEESKEIAFIDPMCGSGTLLIEAALMALDIAPNALPQKTFRTWVIEQLRGVDLSLWKSAFDEAKNSLTRAKSDCSAISLMGFDVSNPVLEAARINIDACGLTDKVSVKQVTLANLHVEELPEQGLVLVNPPYGKRLGDESSLEATYKALGDWLKRDCTGWEAALFTGNPQLGWKTGLRSYRQHHLHNGAIPCDLQRYRIDSDRFIKSVRANEPYGSNVLGDVEQKPLSESAQMLMNRLKKNQKRLARWLTQSGESCYRLYDADLPEYAVAVDVYHGLAVESKAESKSENKYYKKKINEASKANERAITAVHCQEYAPPADVDYRSAEKRLRDVVDVLQRLFEIPESQVVLKQRLKQKGAQQYQRQRAVTPDMWVKESGHEFLVNLSRYLDTGLFLDHRPVRRLIASEVKGKRFLNLFAYTSTATVYAAKAGARSSVSVDMSKTYQGWSRDNFTRNSVTYGQHQLVNEDCLQWLADHKGEYDCILLDPPSFSNSKQMELSWDVQRDHASVIDDCMKRLSADGVLFFSNNRRRFRLDQSVAERYHAEEITESTLDPDFSRRPFAHKCWRISHKA